MLVTRIVPEKGKRAWGSKQQHVVVLSFALVCSNFESKFI